MHGRMVRSSMGMCMAAHSIAAWRAQNGHCMSAWCMTPTFWQLLHTLVLTAERGEQDLVLCIQHGKANQQ
jgi:hypothetical protein